MEHSLSPAPDTEELDAESELLSDACFGTFFIGESEFALAAADVREVVGYPEMVTPVPVAADMVVGMFSLRGEMVPILDVARALNLEEPDQVGEKRIAIVSSGDSHLGLTFDRTGAILRVPRSEAVSMWREHDTERRAIQGIVRSSSSGQFIQVLSPEYLGNLPGVPVGARLSESALDTRTYAKAIVARIGDTEVAFSIEQLREIQDALKLSPVQSLFPHCRGVVQIRDERIAVLDLRSALGLPENAGSSKLVFLQHEGECIGIEVDALVETLEYPEDDALPLPPSRGSALNDMCCAIIAAGESRDVLLADAGRLFGRFSLQGSTKILQVGNEPTSKGARGLRQGSEPLHVPRRHQRVRLRVGRCHRGLRIRRVRSRRRPRRGRRRPQHARHRRVAHGSPGRFSPGRRRGDPAHRDHRGWHLGA